MTIEPIKIVLKQKSLKLMFKAFLVLKAGLEPARTNVHWILSPACLPIPPLEQIYFNFYGSRAKNGVRTRDLDLGKVALYQLSYFRIAFLKNFAYTCSVLRVQIYNKKLLLQELFRKKITPFF